MSETHFRTWRKSTYSGNDGGNCVEAAPAPAVVGVRDTKNREAGHLAVSRPAWSAFVRSVTR